MSAPGIPSTAFSGRSIEPTASRVQQHRGVEDAAAGMEGLFVSMLLKQMRQTLEPGALFSSDNGDVLGGLFDSLMGQHLAKNQGLGIGNMLRRQWTQIYQGTQASTDPSAQSQSQATALLVGGIGQQGAARGATP